MLPMLNHLKNKSILKNLPPEVKILQNFVTPKVAEFREIWQIP